MRVLALSSPSTSHLMVAVPLLTALRVAGHEVLFAGQPDVIGMARSAGLPTVTVGELFDGNGFFHLLPAGKRPIECNIAQPQRGAEGQAVGPYVFHAKYLVDRYHDLALEWRPDLIVADPLEYSALIVGGLLGVPVIFHRWGPEEMTDPGLRVATAMLHAQAVRLGLPGGLGRPALVLDPSPAAWRLPADTAQPIRPVPYNGGGAVPAPLPSPGRRRRVLISLGLSTVQLNGLPLIQHLLDAFRSLDDVEAVVTLDRSDHDRVRAPSNARLIEPAPVSALVDRCDLVIHHGGAGTIIAALTAGLPHLLLPQLNESFARCDRIAASGVAIQLADADRQNDPAIIRTAIRSLLDDGRYLQAATDLAAEVTRMPSPARIVAMLEELAWRDPASTAPLSRPAIVGASQ